MTESQKFADENPEKAKAVLPDYTSLEPDVIEKLTMPRYYAEVNEASIETIAEISLDRGLIEKIPDLTALLPSK